MPRNKTGGCHCGDHGPAAKTPQFNFTVQEII